MTHLMNASAFLAVFPRQLRFWTFHCMLNGAAALIVLQLWKSPSAIVAMLFAIATFILLYATFTSAIDPLADDLHVLSRSLKLGTKIRAWISGLSMFVVVTPAMSIAPDFWCGYFSAAIIDVGARQLGLRGQLIGSPNSAGFPEIYATTLLEGFILSFLLLMISFFAVMFLQARDRKRVFAVADPR